MPKSDVSGGFNSEKLQQKSKQNLKTTSQLKIQQDRDKKKTSSLQKKLKAKQMLKQATQPTLTDEDAKRKITKKISQNRGLTKHTKKEFRNPRVKLRLKYKKAESKHNRLVRKVKGPRPPVEAYDGEATGINDRVVRSVNLSHRS